RTQDPHDEHETDGDEYGQDPDHGHQNDDQRIHGRLPSPYVPRLVRAGTPLCGGGEADRRVRATCSDIERDVRRYGLLSSPCFTLTSTLFFVCAGAKCCWTVMRSMLCALPRWSDVLLVTRG